MTKKRVQRKPWLGDRVKDKVSGATGIVQAVVLWTFGCMRVTVQRDDLQTGAPDAFFTLDAPQFEVLEKGALRPVYPEPSDTLAGETGPAGARPDAGQFATPMREESRR